MAQTKVTRQRRWQLRKQQAGLCFICGGEKAVQNSYCAECWQVKLSNQRTRRRKAASRNNQ